jgi:hypothetical protein
VKRTALATVLITVAATAVAPPASASKCKPSQQCTLYTMESWRLGQYDEPAGTSTNHVSLVDVDRDRDLDLFLAQGTGSFAGRQSLLLINNGRGKFEDKTAERLPAFSANNGKPAWGDLNGDGYVDALVPAAGSRGQLLLGDGRGHFRDEGAGLPVKPQTVTAAVTLVDVDGDRDLDAVFANENPFDPDNDHGAQNWLWINDGRAHFTDQTATRMPARTDQTVAIRAGDIDRDGDSDLIIVNRGQKRVLINNGAGRFSDQTATRFPVTTDPSRDAGLLDIDGDGDLDLVISNSSHSPTTEYHNDGTGRFSEFPLGIPQITDELDSDIGFADLNGDGKTDAYLANAGPQDDTGAHGFTGGPDRFFVGDGHGRFMDRTSVYFPPMPSDPTISVAIGDIDGDGDLDIVAGNGSDKDSAVGHDENLYISHLRD